MKQWISAMRLRTLPLALASIGMGTFLSAADDKFNPQVFVLALLTTISLQILSNLANDYGDSIHGADSIHRSGPSRAVQTGSISKGQMKRAIALAVLISLGLGISLLIAAQVPMEIFLVFLGFGLLALLAAINYTNGTKPYGYVGLGDLSVFIFFGWLGVVGTYYLMTGQFRADLLLPGSACGLVTVAVLNVNNIRDIDSDLLAGKHSIPARLGREKATVYHIALLCLGILCALSFVLLNYSSPKQFLFLLVLPLLYINAKAVQSKSEANALDPYLKQMALSTLAFVLFFGIGIIL